MNRQGFDSRAVQVPDPSQWDMQEPPDASGSWPTRSELEPGFDTIVPRPYAASDFWSADDVDLALGHFGVERNDTIPCPPPELESAPLHDLA